MDLYKSRFLTALGLVLLPLLSFAQIPAANDTLSLGRKLNTRGEFHVHLRSFFMATDNVESLKDYYALAEGAGLSYLSPKIYGFQAGVTGFFIFNLASTDLSIPDAITKGTNRYEIGLFDINNPKNTKDLDRLEDLYLKYNFRKSWAMAGRFELNTPFINRQDGRMRGTIEEGVYAEFNELKNLKVEAGWLWMISPRSTISWYHLENSYGVYPMGLNPDGTKSNYKNNISSAGNGILGLTWSKSKSLKVQAWDMWAENVFNTAMIQIDGEKNIAKNTLLAGVQYIRQDAFNYGGNEVQSKAYIPKGSFSQVVGGRLGYRAGKHEVTINYTRITDDGRFLLPREWGREPFYTFMARERNEGIADMHAVNIRYAGNFYNSKLKPSLTYGHYYLPGVKDASRNKYGLPSYAQINAEVKYSFDKKLKGLQLQLLVVHKIGMGETYNDDRYVFNKVNMTNYNFVLDYTF